MAEIKLNIHKNIIESVINDIISNDEVTNKLNEFLKDYKEYGMSRRYLVKNEEFDCYDWQKMESEAFWENQANHGYKGYPDRKTMSKEIAKKKNLERIETKRLKKEEKQRRINGN